MSKINLGFPNREFVGERNLVKTVGALFVCIMVLGIADVRATTLPFWKVLARLGHV